MVMYIVKLFLQEFLSLSSEEQRGKHNGATERQRHDSLHVFVAHVLKDTSDSENSIFIRLTMLKFR